LTASRPRGENGRIAAEIAVKNISFALFLALPFAALPRAGSAPAEPRDGGDEKWATVKGRVVFAGEKVPEPESYPARREQRLVQRWVVDKKTKGLQDVLVWLSDDPKDRGVRMAAERIHPDLRKPPATSFEMCLVNQQFFPATIGLRAGQDLRFSNTSTEATNIKYQNGNAQSGNVLVPADKSHTIDELRADAGFLVFDSNIHPWMRSYGRVFDHPYFAVTNEKGEFAIPKAPVGKLRLFVWHPDAGFRGGVKGKNGDVIEVRPRGTDLGAIEIKPVN
jgi:hypothetical protein